MNKTLSIVSNSTYYSFPIMITAGRKVAPVIDHVQNRGTLPWTVISKLLGNDQVENSFFLASVTFQFHARMLSSGIAHTLKSWGHFF